MNRVSFAQWLLIGCFLASYNSESSATPSISDALAPTPVQEGVDYDQPSEAEQEHCTIKAEKINGITAWVIRSPNGTILRRFSDANGNNVVDTWSYFLDGLEIYRDIDANHNGKADQHRWFHGAGSRWGVNVDEDKQATIDRWRVISAEEVAEEAVEAIRTKDARRFEALLLSTAELAKLGVSSAQSKKLMERVDQATRAFEKMVAEGQLSEKSQFTDFGGLKPGTVPAGTSGSTKDLTVYESVWAMVHDGTDHQQLQLGTLVNYQGAWKLTSGPQLGTGEEVAAGFFYGTGGTAGEASALPTGDEPTERMQDILADLEKLDKQIAAASAAQRSGLNAKRAKLLVDLAGVAPDRDQWLKQLADMVSASTQDGSYPEGVAYLQKWEEKLTADGEKELAGYFQFQRMLAEYYGVTLAQENVDAAKAHADWLKSLEKFLAEHPRSEHGAEALRQLAMASEISGEIETAVKWYKQILDQFSSSIHAAMAKGAVKRLTSEGRKISLKGKSLQGKDVDLADFQRKVVVIQYWTTSCEVCTSDHSILSDLYKQYGGRRGLEVIGINLDYDREACVEYLNEKRLPWKHLWEPGGFDSRLASELGVVTVPLMLLVGADGKVISSNIRAEEIEGELKKMTQSRAQGNRKPLTR